MMNKTTFSISDDKRTMHVEHVFEVSQDKLWSAYSTKDVFEKWFAPEGWEVVSKRFEFANGGENVYVMTCVDKSQGEWFGQSSAGKMVFENINPKDSFEFLDYFTDLEGTVNETMAAGRSKIELIKQAADTTLLKIISTYDKPEDLQAVIEMGVQEGLGQTLDKLERLLTGKGE